MHSKKTKTKAKIEFQFDNFAVGDIETDPFKDWSKPHEQAVPKCFCAGLYYKGEHFIYWGDDCLEKFVSKCGEIGNENTVIYFHNGGNFDFHYLLPYIDPTKTDFLCIGKRIVTMKTPNGIEFRDSYALVPKALKTWDKDEFDYTWLLKENRRKHKNDILKYLKSDLTNLHSLMIEARTRNGKDQITLAGASFDKLKNSIAPIRFTRTFRSYDSKLRPYYFAGRVGYFCKLGKQNGAYDVFDINSAFPNSMLAFHWFGNRYSLNTSLPKSKSDIQTCFIKLTCYSKGHLPYRDEKSGEVNYPVGRYTFHVTGWEYVMACKLKLLSDVTIHECLVPHELVSYEDFVIPLYEEKLNGRTKADRYFSKLELNSAYGKTGQDPEHFRDIKCVPFGDVLDHPWKLAFDDEERGLSFYSRPTYGPHNKTPMSYNNVAIAASVTGKVRAELMKAIVLGSAVYCDTDSVIVPHGKGSFLPIGSGLGQWKHEFTFNDGEFYLGGKKLYTGKGFDPSNPIEIKTKSAAKGTRLTHDEIIKVCMGETVRYNFAAPSFSLLSGTHFISRVTRRADLIEENA